MWLDPPSTPQRNAVPLTMTARPFGSLIAVAANLPTERKPAADEKPEDKARLDKEFSDRTKALNDKLAAIKPLEKWTYLVSGWTLESLVKNRGELLQQKKGAPSDADATNAEPATQVSPQ